MIIMGAALMVIGAIMIAVAIFLFASGIIGIILAAVGSLFASWMNFLYHLFNAARIDDDYKKYRVDRQKKEELAVTMREENDRLRRIKEKNEAMSISAKEQINRLRKIYYLADESLFDEFIYAFTNKTLEERNEVEKKICEQHDIRVKSDVEYSEYHLKDFMEVDKIECNEYANAETALVEKNGKYIIFFIDKDGDEMSYEVEDRILGFLIFRQLVNKNLEVNRYIPGEKREGMSYDEFNEVVKNSIHRYKNRV